MASDLQIDIQLVNKKVKFEGISDLNPTHPITFDYSPPLGDGDGYAGLELLLMSFSGCVSTAVVALIKRTGKNIEGYRASVKGIRLEKPLSLQKIIYEATITSSDLDDQTVAAIFKTAGEISPVWIAIRNNVAVETAYAIVRE